MAKIYFDSNSSVRVAAHKNIKKILKIIEVDEYDLFITILEYLYYRSQFSNSVIKIHSLIKILEPFELGTEKAEKLITKFEEAGLIAKNGDGHYSIAFVDGQIL